MRYSSVGKRSGIDIDEAAGTNEQLETLPALRRDWYAAQRVVALGTVVTAVASEVSRRGGVALHA